MCLARDLPPTTMARAWQLAAANLELCRFPARHACSSHPHPELQSVCTVVPYSRAGRLPAPAAAPRPLLDAGSPAPRMSSAVVHPRARRRCPRPRAVPTTAAFLPRRQPGEENSSQADEPGRPRGDQSESHDRVARDRPATERSELARLSVSLSYSPCVGGPLRRAAPRRRRRPL